MCVGKEMEPNFIILFPLKEIYIYSASICLEALLFFLSFFFLFLNTFLFFFFFWNHKKLAGFRTPSRLVELLSSGGQIHVRDSDTWPPLPCLFYIIIIIIITIIMITCALVLEMPLTRFGKKELKVVLVRTFVQVKFVFFSVLTPICLRFIALWSVVVNGLNNNNKMATPRFLYFFKLPFFFFNNILRDFYFFTCVDVDKSCDY